MAIGYACLAIGVPGTSISGCTLKNATDENLRKLILKNLEALKVLLDYNSRNDIHLFRISSELIPFGSHPVNKVHWWKDYREVFEELGTIIKKAGLRVSMHPGQYTVLNSNHQEVIDKAVQELIYHARLLDALGVDQSNKLILHIGGVYDNRTEAANRFIREYGLLPEEVKRRLVIENDERCFNISEVLRISKVCGAPVIFDNLHHHINPPVEELSDYQWITQCNHTWSEVDGKQKIHYSQQKDQAKPGSHSDTINISTFIEYYQQLKSVDPDIMLEVKDKNLSAIKCKHVVLKNSTAMKLESEWARYKYYVLSKDAKAYQAIRELLKEKENRVAKEFYEIIERAYRMPENTGAQTNAAQHVWGYLSKDCTAAEKKRYEKLMEDYTFGKASIQTVKNHLLKCANEHGQEYLIESLYFYI
ncbi:MAG: uvdE [Herbinix sp.]|jgi:UV DNA damage endonuclease|nr:uvdE [Herbinix sp.]